MTNSPTWKVWTNDAGVVNLRLDAPGERAVSVPIADEHEVARLTAELEAALAASAHPEPVPEVMP